MLHLKNNRIYNTNEFEFINIQILGGKMY